MVTSLKATEEQDIARLALDIALNRQRLSMLDEPPEPQPLQRDRGEILRALLAANGDKMLEADIKKKMRLDKNHFAEFLKTCDFVEAWPYHQDRRPTVIILKSELVPCDWGLIFVLYLG